jgi:hypothetical protein
MAKKKSYNRDIFDSDDFRNLERQWYNKLKKEGFDDIEYRLVGQERGNGFLKRNDAKLKQAISYGPGRQEYYQVFSQYIHHSPICLAEPKWVQFVLLQHVNAVGVRTIENLVLEKFKIKKNYVVIYKTIQKHKKNLHQFFLDEENKDE